MLEIIIYIWLAVILIAGAHIWSAIKSGMFYAASSGTKPDDLKEYMANMHLVQTPFWYSLFGGFFFMLLALFRVMNPENDLQNISLDVICAVVVMYGTSSMAGPLYQGFINIGGGRPFTDPNEKREFELGNPFTGKTHWFKKFWFGYRRWWLMPIGFIATIIAIVIMCIASR